MRVLQLCKELDFPPEASTVHSRRLLGGKNLDDDLPVEREVGRDEPARHAGAAELTIETEPGTKDAL
jgi:hypothetical protein